MEIYCSIIAITTQPLRAYLTYLAHHELESVFVIIIIIIIITVNLVAAGG